MRWVWPLSFSLVLAACGDPAPRAFVEVAPLASGEWRATWHGTAPIDTLRFVRPAHWLREREWRVVTPGYEFSRDGDAQVLRRTDGSATADLVVVDFPVNTEYLERDYELFNEFSDGSVAIFTGHFFASVNGTDTQITDVEVSGPPGTPILVDARPDIHGTYAYVGGIQPVDHARVVAVVDPGLPSWLEASLTTNVPRLFDYFSARTGQSLDTRPLVLFSFVPGPARDINGGTLGNLVQLRASGDAWHDDNPWAVREALRLIAHESAHLWNGNLARFRPGSPPWMHEGGAEAFADEALHALGVMDAEALDTAYQHALNECVQGRRIHYACGQVAAWWTGLAVAAASPGADLFSFWGALAERAAAGDGHYGPEEYFAEMSAHGVPEGAVAQLRAFVDGPVDIGAAVRDGVARYGIVVRRDDAAADRRSGLAVSAGLLVALLARDCRGPYGFYNRENGFELAGLGDCGIARDGMVIDAFGGVALDAPGLGAARHLMAQCASHGRIVAGKAEFTCPVELPPLRGYWTVIGDSE